MIIDGIEIPQEYAGDNAMTQAYILQVKSKVVTDPAEPPADPITPPANPPADSAPVNVNWGEFGEEFKSKEDIANAIIEYRSLKAKPAPVESPIDDPTFYRLAKLKAEAPEEYPLFKKLVLDEELDPIELLTLDYIRENPSFKGQEAKVKNFLKRNYGLHLEIPTEPAADDQSPEAMTLRAEISMKKEEREFAEMRMRGDAERIKRSLLNERFEKIELPKKVDAKEIATLREQRKGLYEKVAPETIKQLATLPIMIKNEKGEMVKAMDFQLSDAHKKRLSELIIDFGTKLDGQPNTEHATTCIANAIASLKEELQGEMNTVLFTSARAMAEQDYYKVYHNPAPIRGTDGGGSGGNPPAPNLYQESRDAALKAERGNR